MTNKKVAELSISIEKYLAGLGHVPNNITLHAKDVSVIEKEIKSISAKIRGRDVLLEGFRIKDETMTYKGIKVHEIK